MTDAPPPSVDALAERLRMAQLTMDAAFTAWLNRPCHRTNDRLHKAIRHFTRMRHRLQVVERQGLGHWQILWGMERQAASAAKTKPSG